MAANAPVGAPDNAQAAAALQAAIAALLRFIGAEQDPQDRDVAHTCVSRLQAIQGGQQPPTDYTKGGTATSRVFNPGALGPQPGQ